ncbi:cupredoxin domain-containing protein [Brevibacillus ginsengisoli]|uniref:cupredoxin domain-containing protein n=1 Tax=Brevibacillus ginsengisoli TaxID=363854 RepID=UPI003CF09960
MMNDYLSKFLRYRHPLIALFLTLLLLFLHSSYTVKPSSAQHLVAQHLTITKYGFLPNQLTCDTGDTVTLTVTNTDTTTHYIDLSTLGVHTVILSAGESSTITFVANHQGIFPYHSAPDPQADNALRGLLIVR